MMSMDKMKFSIKFLLDRHRCYNELLLNELALLVLEEQKKVLQDLRADHDHEFYSECCAAIEHPNFAGLCHKCRDHCSFSCECGATRTSRHEEIET